MSMAGIGMNDAARIDELKRLLPQCLLKDQLRIGLRLAKWLSDHRQHRAAPAPLERWLTEARASTALRQTRQERLPAVNYPPELPISHKRDDIVAALRKHQVLVIAGETGSGKTTQLPKMCLEAGFGVRARIGCTQPRRVAALSLSRRLAEELNMDWGREVGCKIRFSDQTRPETYIKFMTDGILLAEAQADPFLSEYEVIIIDEAHERSLNIDFLLGCLKNLLQKRDDLKLIITSATIDTEAFSRAFNHAPIIEVSGRMYPVEVMYYPLDEHSEEEGDFTYIDAAVKAVEDIIGLSNHGDILVFMPGERDILETRDALQGRFGNSLELVPLFGRLSADEQQRIFAPCRRRKIVVATNIAETSLTVPGIHYVVDTGLARLSQYNPRTRTKRLPIEPISQSSANQRKGRCGRVAAGLCFRLYSEADFQSRPLYTQPEIQRANLAEVILRMKAFKVGDIENFPFLNPPSPQAIQGGYQLLQELGALDEQRQLTEIGGDLARLPVDPTIGRMILQARHENALRETLVIAAGLSIQDPRERPADRPDTAAAAQRRFLDPRSDFLGLLNIWNAFHDTLESLRTQSQMRKFCKAHFLSYPRMREWRDIHAQLQETLEDMGDARENTRAADYAAIHRSILTGLWAHVALKKERNIYQLAGDRQAMVFPGSGLFERNVQSGPRKSPGKTEESKPAKSSQPAWIVAGEIVETSRLFARSVAEIDPLWILELAPHLCRQTIKDPRWDAATGRVLAQERVTLNGLEVVKRVIPYGKTHPAEATAMFIQSALIEEGLADHLFTRRGRRAPHAPPDTAVEDSNAASESDYPRDLSRLPALYGFLAHNQQLRHKIEIWQTRLPHRVVADLDQSYIDAYSHGLSAVSTVADLNRVLKDHLARQPGFLRFSAAEILGDQASAFNAGAFPDAIHVGDQTVPLQYAYAPGKDHDGVTVRLPITLAQVIDPNLLDWAVPALRESQILYLLQALPKEVRRELMPLPPKAQEMAALIIPQGDAYLRELMAYIRTQYSVAIPASDWTIELLPAHLRPRFEILGQEEKSLVQGRDLQALRAHLHQHDTTAETEAWRSAVAQWERYHLTDWNFGDLPEQVTVTDVAGFPLHAFAALQVEEGHVSLRLFRKLEDAQASHGPGLTRLAETLLHREMAWLQKDLRALGKWKDLYVTLGPVEELEESSFENLKSHLLRAPAPPPRTAASFSAWMERVRQELPGLALRLGEHVGEILRLRQAILLCAKPYPGLRQEMDTLLPRQFPRFIPFVRLPHLPRYLKAMLVRAERAAVNPAKDKEKALRVQPFLEALQPLFKSKNLAPEAHDALSEYYWLVQEYKVSCFAQELGTAEPVSTQKLQHKLQALKSLLK